MKTQNTETNREIGELISEIIESGWNQIKSKPFGVAYVIQVENDILYSDDPESDEWLITRQGTLPDALRDIVDTIRKYIGKPTLEEEVSNMLASEQEHEKLPPIITGPDARCRCGSDSPLVGKRTVRIYQHWNGSFELEPGYDALSDHGEILTCQDCGRNYAFSERQS